jgi:muconolactone delta-isomerase
MPLHPWMSVEVTPIIEHPATRAYEERVGPFPPL